MVGIPGGPLCFRGAQAACVGWLVCGTGVTGGAGAPQFHQSKHHRHQFRNPTGAHVLDSFPPGTSLMILMQFSRFSKFPRPWWLVLSPEEPLPAPHGPWLSPLASRGPSGQAHFAAPKAGHAARCPPAVTSAEPGGPPVVRGGTAEAPGGRLRAGLAAPTATTSGRCLGTAGTTGTLILLTVTHPAGDPAGPCLALQKLLRQQATLCSSRVTHPPPDPCEPCLASQNLLPPHLLSADATPLRAFTLQPPIHPPTPLCPA